MKIDKGIPIPPSPSGRYANRYDFRLVESGDSIWTPTHLKRKAVTTAFYKWKKKTETDLVTVSRQVDESDPGGPGYRIWFITEGEAP